MEPITMTMLGLSALGAGLGWWGNKKNRDSTEKTNQKNIDFSREMYARERQDALDDWARTNQYNAPEEQMNRLRQAGLNPNLIYGKGAENTASAIRSSSGQSVNQVAPEFDYSSIPNEMGKFFDFRAKQAQTDNMQANTELAQKQQFVMDANISKTLQDTARSQFDLDQAKRLRDVTFEGVMLDNEMKRANVDSTTTSTYVNLDRNEREKLSSAANLKKTLEEILSSKAGRAKTQDERNLLQENLRLVQNDNRIKEYDIKLQKWNLKRSDPAYLKGLFQMLHNPPDTSGRLYKANKKLDRFDQKFNNLFK